MKKYYSRLILATIMMTAFTLINAQTKLTPINQPITKFKPPVVHTYLGTLTGKTAVTSPEEGKNLIVAPLSVTDAKKTNYTVASYQFVYKRLGSREDEETGKITTESELVASQFNAVPLPAIWQSNITETLKKGESLLFFDIIVFDKQGRRFFAPDLNISIQ